MAWFTVFLLLPLVCRAVKAPVTDGQAPALSRPKCYIPHNGDPDIHCSWEPVDMPLSPAEYAIHWEPDDRGNQGMADARDSGGIIPRVKFRSHDFMCVWVTARGVQVADRICFNTADIEQPCAPEVLNHTLQPLQIIWKVHCSQMDSFHCEVQYRMEGEEGWIKEDEDTMDTFLLRDVQPFSMYEFRVRCTCSDKEEAPSSSWSNTYMVRIAEAAPVGVLDLWIRCGESSDHSDCILVWKELPRHLARGEVVGYMLAVENETKAISTEELGLRDRILGAVTRPGSGSGCCFYLLPLSLHNVTAVHLTAVNSKGATEPTRLALPSPDRLYNLSMNATVEEHGQKLRVSWRMPPEAVEEYVVQIDEGGGGGLQRFDWIKVNQSRDAVIEGDFRNYTPYNLSLFGVSSNRRRLLAMTTVYTVQDVPPKVKRFQVFRLSASEVTLTWQLIPIFESKGVILSYRLGLSSDTAEYKVHRDLDSYTISGLQQGRNHMAWICAETKAGRGPLSTITFFIPASTDVLTVVLITIALAALLCLLCCWGQWRVTCSPSPAWCHDKVPDPTNSRLFKPDQNINIWESLCSPESNQKMSCLEVVEWEDCKGKEADKPSVPLENEMEEEQISEEGEDTVSAHSTVRDVEMDLGSGVNSYSEMNDTDGAEAHGASLEETSFSGYEKHYMPRPCDVSSITPTTDTWNEEGE